MRTYYQVDHRGDGSLLGLIRINRDDAGHLLSFETFHKSSGEWVDDPSNAAYMMQGEPGASRITEQRAAELQAQLLASKGQGDGGTSQPEVMRAYHRVDHQGDGSLLGLFRINRNDDGHIVSYETFNRKTHRWVDDPSKSAYVFSGEVGATQISADEAAALERQLSQG